MRMSIPLVRLQSLDFVRGFVAVGRRMSITLAADDLCLTQSAVSRQVHALEEALGLKLLKRGHRSISFTPEGERFFGVADIALRQLQDVIGALDTRQSEQTVTITASIGVAGLWLLPRLASLQRLHPEIDVRVAASDKIVDLQDGNVDVAIRYCAEGPNTPGALRLFNEEIVPVAHPSLCKSGTLLSDALAGNALLEFDDVGRSWLQWSNRLRAMGLGSRKIRGILRFNQYDQVIHAALAAQGIAIGRRALIEPLLQAGRLVAMQWDKEPEASGYAYWMLIAESNPRSNVRKVVEWIMSQAGHAGSLQKVA